MKPFQKMVADDGLEVVLFPLEYLYMTQDEGGDFSHAGTYNLDFVGYNGTSVVKKCPYYAPCTLKCVAIWDANSNQRVYESVNKVHLADGTIDYLTIEFAHDDNPQFKIGDVVPQGNLIGHTGTTGNVTGDHVHTCCGKGKYQGFTRRSSGLYDLTNRTHYWLATYVNDTPIIRGFGHPWQIFEGGSTPTPIQPYNLSSGKFPWVLYARKLRDR